MLLPTLDKDYRFAVNVNLPAEANETLQYQQLWLALKNAFLGLDVSGSPLVWTDKTGANASAPVLWQLRSSCNSVNFGNNDNVDHITTQADVISGTSAGAVKSWWHLENTAIGIHMAHAFRGANGVIPYTKMEGNLASPDNGLFGFSISGFGAANGGSDGNTTTRPTSADSEALIGCEGTAGTATGDYDWFGDFSGTVAHRMHVIASVDGEVWTILFCRNGFTAVAMMIEKNRDSVILDPFGTPHTQNGADKPWVAFYNAAAFDAASQRALQHANISSVAAKWATHLGNLADSTLTDFQRLYIAGERIRAADNPGLEIEEIITSQLDGLRPFVPYTFWSLGGGKVGKVGRATDKWLGHDTPLGVAEGDTYPLNPSPTKEFASFGSVIFPWNGTTPLLNGVGSNTDHDGTLFIPVSPVEASDVVPPVVSYVTPVSEIDPNQTIVVEVTDDVLLRRVVLLVTFQRTGNPEWIHDGDDFSPRYKAGSLLESISGGFRFTIKRTGGWPQVVGLQNFMLWKAIAIDTGGNEAV